jgi:hypothetical protein
MADFTQDTLRRLRERIKAAHADGNEELRDKLVAVTRFVALVIQTREYERVQEERHV